MSLPIIKLYGYQDSPYVARVQWLLEELALDYDWVEVDLLSGQQHKQEYLMKSPFGQVPAIEIDGTPIYDSMVILRYLATRFGKSIYSENFLECCTIDSWASVVSNEIGEPISKLCWQRYWKQQIGKPEDLQYSKRLESQLLSNLGKLELRLSANKYIYGEFGVADIAVFPLIVLYHRAKVDLSQYPSILRWLSELKKRPSFEKVRFSYSSS